jgi:septum formation protein
MKIPLVLASQSPRRKDLLEKLQIPFTVFPVFVSEDIEESLSPKDQVSAISEKKFSEACRRWKSEHPNQKAVVLTADTLVYLEESPGKWISLAKPKDLNEARQMLKKLSGKEHTVITAMTLGWENMRITETDSAIVQFKLLSEDEIQNYIQEEAVLDKAGSYGFQGSGRRLVEKFSGDEETIIGLNTKTFLKMRSQLGKLFPELKN